MFFVYFCLFVCLCVEGMGCVCVCVCVYIYTEQIWQMQSPEFKDKQLSSEFAKCEHLGWQDHDLNVIKESWTCIDLICHSTTFSCIDNALFVFHFFHWFQRLLEPEIRVKYHKQHVSMHYHICICVGLSDPWSFVIRQVNPSVGFILSRSLVSDLFKIQALK